MAAAAVAVAAVARESACPLGALPSAHICARRPRCGASLMRPLALAARSTPKRAKGNAGGNARSAPQGSDSASEEVSAEDVEATEVENSVASAAAGKSAVEPSYVAASPGALQAREKRVLNDLDNLLGESDTEA